MREVAEIQALSFIVVNFHKLRRLLIVGYFSPTAFINPLFLLL